MTRRHAEDLCLLTASTSAVWMCLSLAVSWSELLTLFWLLQTCFWTATYLLVATSGK
jgi:hypothetical protein